MKEKKELLIGIALGLLIGFGIFGFLFLKQKAAFKNQLKNKELTKQTALLESVRVSNFAALMNNVLSKADEELAQHPNRKLSDETIERIAALSFAFKPYHILEGDSLSEKKLSPERGQLLLALANLKMDSSSFNKIKFKTSFANADLRGVNLRKAYLRQIDLRDANLKDADLRNANLEQADLRSANLWGANLDNANLEQADLKRADFRWANLNGANLSGANMNNANLDYAKLRRADLSESNARWANLNGVLLNEANLTGLKLYRSFLRKVVLTKANLTETDFTFVTVERENWLENLDDSNVVGAKEIQTIFTVTNNAVEDADFLIEKKKH